MTFSDKVESSIILSSERIHYKQLNILNNKQRFRAIVFVLLMAIYTIYTKIILNNFTFDILVIANIVSVISIIYLKTTAHSLYELNHYKLTSFMLFINKLSKLIIFIFAVFMYYESINNALLRYYKIDFAEFWYYLFVYLGSSDTTFIEIIKNFYYRYEFIHLASFIVSSILFIPTFLYFMIFLIRRYCKVLLLMIPFVNVIIYFQWLFRDNTIFCEYVKENDTFYIKNTRKFKCFGYNLRFFLIKAFISIVILTLIILIILFI